MTLEQQQIRQWMKYGQQSTPNIPGIPHRDVGELRVRLIAEELRETARGLGFDFVYHIEEYFGFKPNLIEIADGCADLKVVVIGTEVACGIDGEPTFQEVMRSNNTKLIKDANGKLTVIKNHHGKIMKPSTYEPPNLVPIIEHQIANPLL